MASTCQACGASGLHTFYAVRGVPVHSCLMVDSREEALAFPRGDLELGFCSRCGFVQNTLFDPSLQSYSREYEETQGFSPRFRRFQTELCEDQVRRYGLRDKRVLEIGCGKGEFLVELCELSGAHGVGIDPSYRPERTTSPAAERIEFITDFYSREYTHLRADYVCCRHTLEHVQPVREFVEMVRGTLEDEDTVVFFELPDAERVLDERAFWDVYYEHCSYFTLGSLARLFRAADFALLDLYKVYDGQYLMIEARPGAGASGGRSFAAEDDLDATRRKVEAFSHGMEDKLASLRRDLERFVRTAARPVVWGSGSKAVSYLTTLGVTDEVEYVVDINPHKHGKFMAGSGHEIVAPELLASYCPEVVVVMNPIYREEIRAQLRSLGLEPELVTI